MAKAQAAFQLRRRIKQDPEFAALHRTQLHRHREHGLTPEAYTRLYEEQHGCCAICKRSFENVKVYVDHCHTTLRVRGLLCPRCNSGLGMFRDSSEFLQRAIDYVGPKLAPEPTQVENLQ